MHSWFSLIWHATCPCSENVEFWPLTPPQWSRGGGKIFITAMLIYRHWVIIAYSEKLSDISFGEMWRFHNKGQYSFSIGLNICQKGHYSVKRLQITSKFELDLYFMMIYPSLKFERNCCFPSKVIDRKPQIDNIAKIQVKKGPNSVNFLRITPFFELGLYLMMRDRSVKYKWNWCIRSRVIDQKPKVWRRGRRWSHDPYMPSLLPRWHKKEN